MAIGKVSSPFEMFFDQDGEPLDNGSIYVGTRFLNPETNPIQVYWDENLSIPAAQPIKTTDGYPARMGSPANVFPGVAGYSITVRDKKGRLVYSSLDATGSQILTAPTGSQLVGWSRLQLSDDITNVHQALDAQPVNIFEYADLVSVRPNPSDPSTWDWTSAINAACSSANSYIVISQPIRVAGFATISGTVEFNNTGKIIFDNGSTVSYSSTQVIAPLRQVFQITPVYSLVTVANTTTQARRISNISGSLRNEFVEPEWFGAVPYVASSAIDSYAAIDISGRLGNVHLNDLYCISRAYLFQNKRIYRGTRGRPSDCGFVASPSEIAFTGLSIIYNYEQAGVSDFSAANGENQNPYVYLENFCTISVGMYRTGTTDNVDAFRQVDLFTWETTRINKVTTYVRSSGSVATPTMYQIFRHQNGPATISDIDFVGVEGGVNIDCLADSSVEFSKMTNMDVRNVNMNINCNKALKAICLKEAPSTIYDFNIERHPSRFGGNASTRPSIIAQGPIELANIKLSTEAASSLAIRILKRPDVSWESMPVLRNISTQAKPNDVVGYFSRFIEIFDTVASSTIETIDATYLFSGGTQTITSITGIAFFDGADLRMYGGSTAIANHKNASRSFRRNFGTVAASGTVTIPVPRCIGTGAFANIQYSLKVSGRGSGNLSAMHFGYIEGTGTTTSSLRNTAVVGGSVWTLAGSISSGTGSLVLTNATAGSISDVTVDVDFTGTPTTN